MRLEKPTSIWLGGIYGLVVCLFTVGFINYIHFERIPIRLTTSGLLAVMAISALLGNYLIGKLFEYNDAQWHRPVWVMWVGFASTFPLIIIILALVLLFYFSS